MQYPTDQRARHGLMFLLIVLVALFQACGGKDEAPVAFELIPSLRAVNPLSAVDPTALPDVDDTGAYFYVFRSPQEWATWWRRVDSKFSPEPLPVVDFSTSTVAVVYLGMRTNSCYVLNVGDVVQRGGVVLVRYRETKPPAGSTCSPAGQFLRKLIRIEATGLPIEFESQ